MKYEPEIVQELREKERNNRDFISTKNSSKNSNYLHLPQNNKSDKNLEYERFKNFFENAPVYGYLLSPDGKILEVNKMALTSLGYEKEELIEKHLSTVCAPEYHEKLNNLLLQWKETNKIDSEEVVIVTKQGEKRTVLLCVNSVRDADGKILYFVFIQKDVTEINKIYNDLNKNLELQNIKLQQLNEAKTIFLKTTSHELRTPITSIKGYIQMLLKKSLGEINEEQKKSLEVILRNINHLDQIIQNILDASSLKSGIMKFISYEVNPKILVEEIIKTIQPFAYKRNMTINVDIEKDLPNLIVDIERIKQVLKNLVDNAMKFSTDGSIINIKARKEKEDILFEIQDFGQGIPKDKQELIFDTFYQVDSGMDRKFGGAGLSLALSKGIIKSHGGDIWVDSTEGKGSTFRFTLPIKSKYNIDYKHLKNELPPKDVLVEGVDFVEKYLKMNIKDENASYKQLEWTKLLFKDLSDKTIELIEEDSGNEEAISDTAAYEQKEELLRNEEIYRMIFENVNDEIIYVNKYGKIIDVNKRVKDIFGYKRKDIIGKNFNKLGWFGVKDLPKLVKLFNCMLRGKTIDLMELEVKHKDGHKIFIEVNSRPVKKNGKIVGILSIVRDISERKRVEQRLKESERRYKTLFDSSPDLIIETDEKGNILAFNSMMTKSIGAPSEKLIGKNIFEIFPREIAEERAKIARKALEEMKIQERDNEWAGRYFHNIYAPIVHPDGKKTIQLITRDETLQKKVEEELRYLKEYNENILESNPNPIMVVKGTQIEYVNKSFVFIFGETKNKYIARNLKDVIPSEIFPVFENLLQEDGRSKELKFRGKEFIVHSFVVKKTEEEETRRGMVFQDISELKRAEDARRFNEEKLRKVIDSSPDNITVSDLNGNIIDCNQATVDMHGFSTKEEIIGKNALELIAPKDHEKAMEQLKKTLDVGSVKNVEYTFLKKDGSEFPAEISASVIKDSSGKPVSFIGVIKDISERKRAEQLLKESEEKFRTIFDNSTEGILLADMENKKFFTGNKAICSMLGYNLEEIKNLDVSEIHPKEDLQFVVEQFEKQVRKEIILAKNIPVKRKNGSIFYTDINSAPTTIAGKTYLMGSFRDVTERKQAEEALKKSENRYRASIELTHLLAWTTSDSGEVVEDIPIWRKFTGQSYEEVKGIGWTKAIHPDDLEQTIRLWKKAVETKNTYEIEYRVRRDDGVFRSFLTRGIPILKEDGRIKEWVGICIDITERKKIEKELKESEEKYRNVVERASDGIVIVQDMIVKYVNPRVFEILGYKPSEIIGASMTDYIHPDELPNVIEHYKRRMAGDSVPRSYESMLVRRDGRVIYVELSGRDIVYQGQPADMIMVHDITDRKKVENNLKEKIDELERFKKLTIERELKMIELKIQIRKLEENLKELAPPDQKFKENLME